MERLLHYVWKNKLFPTTPLTTTDGLAVEVIDPGLHNSDAGPDFFNAKVRIDGTLWAGCVEIHDKASDWHRHRHQTDKAYDSVILHVTGCDDGTVYQSNGEQIPQLVLTVPESVRKNIDWLLNNDRRLPCQGVISTIDPIHIVSFLDALLFERLERKVEDIKRLLNAYQSDWNEVFYILLTRTFGGGVNSDAFERLAKSLPLKYIQKQRNNPLEVEALLFGQAGLLEQETGDTYYQNLRRDYLFLQKKYDLKPLDITLFKNLRIRPGSFPHIKIAQLAAFWNRHDTLFSVVRETVSIKELGKLFQVEPSAYWTTHYHFRSLSVRKSKPVSETSRQILFINVVVPMLVAWSKHTGRSEYRERAMSLLESLPPERNQIITLFQSAGITARNACDTQALIQLKRAWCEQKKCLYCRIGFRVMKKI